MAIAGLRLFSGVCSHFSKKSENEKKENEKKDHMGRDLIGLAINIIVAGAATCVLVGLVRHLGMPVGLTKLAHLGLGLGLMLGPLGLIALFESAAYKVGKCVADRADRADPQWEERQWVDIAHNEKQNFRTDGRTHSWGGWR